VSLTTGRPHRVPAVDPAAGRGTTSCSISRLSAGLRLILAGVFEVERRAVPDAIEETIHSDATLTAFTLIITAMLLLDVVCRRDPRWTDFRVIAAVLAIIAAASPPAGRS
jgi:hypothetical protein